MHLTALPTIYSFVGYETIWPTYGLIFILYANQDSLLTIGIGFVFEPEAYART
jgi:hypothetical protein